LRTTGLRGGGTSVLKKNIFTKFGYSLKKSSGIKYEKDRSLIGYEVGYIAPGRVSIGAA
jgi:hypothetical protein